MSVEEQVRANFKKLDGTPGFAANRVWLTFYLAGSPEKLWAVSERLANGGWLNTGGWEGAFLYPKVQTDRTVAAIMDVAQATKAICDEHQVKVLNIDADSSAEVRRSHFVTLYQSD